MEKKNLLIIQVVPSGFGGIQSYAKSLKKNLEKEQIKVINLETYTVNYSKDKLKEIFLKIKKIIKNSFKIKKIINEYKKNNKIIVHNHIAVKISFWENSWYSFLAKLSNVPYIFHVHSSLLHIENKKSGKIKKIIRKKIFNNCSKIIALSEYWKNKILEIDVIDSEKVVVINNFVEISEFKEISKKEARKMLNIPNEKKIIFGFGRLVERKGFQYLIEATPKIIEKRSDVLFYIGGKGPMKENYEKRIRDLGITNFFKLIGFIPNEDLNLWFHAADIFVLPSLRETFPIIMLESIACGTPVVGSRIAALPEVFHSENYGLLVEPGNVEDLTGQILIGLNKKWDMEKIRSYAGQFTWNKIANKILILYKQVIKNH